MIDSAKGAWLLIVLPALILFSGQPAIAGDTEPAAPTALHALYAITNGAWNNGATWSLSPNGGACGCIPNNESQVSIPGNRTVTIGTNSTANSVAVKNGGQLLFGAANVTVVLEGNAGIQVQEGASWSSNGFTGISIAVAAGGTVTMDLNNPTNSIFVDAITLENGSTLNAHGNGKVTVANQLSVGDFGAFNNHLAGSMVVAGTIVFAGEGATLNNYSQLETGGDILYQQADASNINNFGTLLVGGNIEAESSANAGIYNDASALLHVYGDDIELNNTSTGFVIENRGTVVIEDDLKESPAGADAAHFYNHAGATLKLGHDSPDQSWKLHADYANSTVEYHRLGNQPHLFDPVDAYHHLVISGTGSKRSSGNLDINGNLAIVGAAQLDIGHHHDDIALEGHWMNSSTHVDAFKPGVQVVGLVGPGTQNISAIATESFYGFTVDKQAGMVLLQVPVRIDNGGALSLQRGVVHTSNDYLLTLSAEATTNRGTALSFIDGPMAVLGVADVEVPVGNEAIWAPIDITNRASASEQERLVVEFFAGATPANNSISFDLGSVSQRGYWNVNQTNGTATADVALHWTNAAQRGIATVSDVAFAHYNADRKQWENRNGVLNAVGNAGSIAARPAGFGSFALATEIGMSPLPITLVDFSAELVGGAVALRWETASEFNNDWFTVERSADGVEFTDLLTVAGAGTISEAQFYAEKDLEPLAGVAYYRLRQTDGDGTSTRSGIVAVENKARIDTRELTVYPNPASAGAAVYVQLPENTPDEVVLVTVYDAAGRPVHQQSIFSASGAQLTGLADLAAGTYMMAFQAAGQRTVQPFVVR